jgi:modulator of FtsH protease HflC
MMERSLLRSPTALAVFGLALLILLSMSISIVPETKQAIISNYGQPLRVVNAYRPKERFGYTNAGIAFRIPFLEQIHWVDKRILSVEMERQEVLSTDQLRLQVDAFARFRVTKPVLMYKTIRTEDGLRDQLKTILGSRLRNELGKRSFATLLSPERGAVMENIQKALNREANRYGAEIIDVRIKRADLPEGTPLAAAFARMQSARKQEANAIDAEGQKEAQIIRATAQAEAARIYAASFNKDVEFYDFYRAMQSYRQTFRAEGEDGAARTNIVLSPNNDYLRKFRDGR